MKQDDRGLYGIYEWWHQPLWQRSWFVALVVGIAVCALIVFLVWAVRRLIAFIRYKKSSPWSRAMQDLSGLSAIDYRSADQIKEAYFRLTDLLKRYFADHMNYDVVGKTDQEMLIYLEKNKFPAVSLERLSTIVHGCLMVKFAQVSTAQENIAHHIDLAIMIVQETKEK